MVGKTLLHYRILKELGKGGMGVVYKAEDQKLHRVVALKVLLANLVGDEKARKRFMREARAASAIDHPNICTVYEINETPNMLFFVMQYVEGATLKKTINGRAMPVEMALEIWLQLADALAEAHSHGVIHRDIKSSNVVMTERGQPKILDFGLAKLTEPSNGRRRGGDAGLTELTQRGVPFGTASYMSPEQAQGEPADQRSDIYSLGVVMYEMVTGRLPFRGKTSIDVMHGVIHDPLPPLPDSVPAPFARIIERALAKSRSERYQTAAEMLDELKRAARMMYTERRDLPVDRTASFQAMRHEDRPKTFGRVAKWFRRNVLGQDGMVPSSGSNDEPSHEFTVESAEGSVAAVSNTSVQNKRAIAILPFKNVSGDRESDFYGFSLADSVITELAQLKSLIVRPSTYVAKYQNLEVDPRQVGMELAVDSVLVGSYIKAGDRFRVTPQLIDIKTGEIIWSDKIDLDSKDIITLQDKISQHIVDGLRIRITDQEQDRLTRAATRNYDAYEQYLRGRSLLNMFVTHTINKQDLDDAVIAFKRAVDIDPEFVLAHSALGVSYSTYVMKGMGGISYYDEAEAACKRALQIDPKAVEPRVTLVYIYMGSGDKQKARELVEELRREAPNDTSIRNVAGTLYRLDGRYEEALREFDRQLKINPTEIAPVSYNKARIYMYTGDFDTATAEIERGRAVEPDHPMLRAFAAQILYYRGRLDEAAKLYEDVFEAVPTMRGLLPLLGIVYAKRGERERAAKLVSHDVIDAACADFDIAYWTASLYALEGDRTEALTWLERAVELGNENFPWFERDPNWDGLRQDPKYLALIARLKEQHEVPIAET